MTGIKLTDVYFFGVMLFDLLRSSDLPRQFFGTFHVLFYRDETKNRHEKILIKLFKMILAYSGQSAIAHFKVTLTPVCFGLNSVLQNLVLKSCMGDR